MTEKQSPRDPERGANLKHDKVVPISQGFLFNSFPPAPEDATYFIEIERWTRGKTDVIDTLDTESVEDGVRVLRNIGHSWRYDNTHMGYVKRSDGTVMATLHIFEHTYRVDLAGEEEY